MKIFITKFILSGLLLFCFAGFAQNLKLKSKIELRNWLLTSKAMKSETFLNGASIKLLKGDAVVSQATSDATGNFEMDVPPNGEFVLMVEYPGHEPKKFAVNTKTTPPNKEDANFKPSIDIVGILMSKPKKGMENIGLNQPSVTSPRKNEYLRTNIYDGDYKLIQKFCTANKLGDLAMENKNYSLAKTFYEMAINMIDSEEYPKTQLKKAEDGMKMEKASRKKQKFKSGKTKSAITKQKPGPNSTIKTKKTSVETGKPPHKTLKPL